MFAAVDNFPALLIWIPLLGGLFSFFLKDAKQAKSSAIVFAASSLLVLMVSMNFSGKESMQLNQVSYEWLSSIGSNFGLILDGLTRTMSLLTAIVFLLVFILVPFDQYKDANRFYGLMLLTQCGLVGVFMATDALVFYLFWELALIPVYFLASIWGGEKRIRATFKFFIYTFIGSLLMLVAILYMYNKTNATSFGLSAFFNLTITATEQYWLFSAFFVAFAIKMPLFPLHTWQPEAYEQSPAPVTMVLSSVMVKMGLFGLLRWIMPLFPLAVKQFNTALLILIAIGVVYASLVAIYQDNIKRLIAYSSIAHIGLMAMGILTLKEVAISGALIQMFNHGVNILALWIVAYLIEKQTGILTISQLGGLAKKAPVLSIFMLIAVLANVALPLTNAFIGEFMIFNGIYQVNKLLAAFTGLSIIFSAVYSLNMVKNVFYGTESEAAALMTDIKGAQVVIFIILTVLILVVGIYPQPFFQMFSDAMGLILNRYNS
jgi:NADH-quinone oxidoreductase subunit M